MSWQAFRKKMPFHSGNSASKSSSSKKTESITDVNPTNGIPATTENIAKILIIGETGSGKSTFINYLTNYFLGGAYDKPRIAIPTRYYPVMTESFGHCENALDDVTISKTDACHQYRFREPKTNNQYLFLDTPGLGDTRGTQQDQTNIDTILNAINNLQDLTGVVIVVNGSMARITTNFKSVLLGLRGNLPDIVLDHVILILSHVKRHQSTFDIKKTLKMNGTNVYPYYMQNSAFAQDPKIWGTHEHEHIERDWLESMEEIEQMLSTINTFQTKSVAAFDDMRTIRNAIKTCMHEARLEITQVQRMHDEILAYEQAVKKYQGEEVSYQDYTQEQTITMNELVDAPYHSTICTTCNFVCHENCSLGETEEVGNQIFQKCTAMDRGSNSCKRCPDNCGFSEHYHARKMMQTSEKQMTTVLYDIKAKFDFATKNKNDFEQKLNSSQDARKLMEQVLRQKIDAIQAQCRELRKVCGSFNLVQELHILVEQLKVEAQTLTSLEARSKAEMVIRELNTFCQNLEAQEPNITASKSEMIVVDTGSGSNKTATKFISSTRNKVQESNDKVIAVEKILEAQLKKKKVPVTVTNSSDLSVYEPIDYEDQEDSQMQHRLSFPSNQWKSANQNQQHPTSQCGQIYSVEPPTAKGKSLKYEMLTVKELVDELRAAIAQNYSKVAIERELRNRAQGITCPMITASDRSMFARYTNKYSCKSSSEISHQYMRLQKHVNSLLGNENMNLEKITTIPPELLVELATLYTLFSSEESATTDPHIGEQQHNNYRRSSPPPNSRITRSHRVSSLEPDHDRDSQRPTYHSNNVHQSNYFESTTRDYDNPETCSGVYTEKNMSAPPSYNDAVGPQNQSSPQTRSRSTVSSNQAQRRDRQISNTRLSNHKSSASYDATPSVDDHRNRHQPNSDFDLALMTTDKLLELYNHARKMEDNVQQVAIYTELEKRCNGADSQLMTNPVMEQTLARYQRLDVRSLNDKLDAIKKEIRELTNGGDATQIENISKDLLIKITAITSILQDRPLENTYF